MITPMCPMSKRLGGMTGWGGDPETARSCPPACTARKGRRQRSPPLCRFIAGETRKSCGYLCRFCRLSESETWVGAEIRKYSWWNNPTEWRVSSGAEYRKSVTENLDVRWQEIGGRGSFPKPYRVPYHHTASQGTNRMFFLTPSSDFRSIVWVPKSML